MKVLFIHTNYARHGGEDAVCKAEIQLLKSRGVEVETLIFDNEKRVVLHLLLAAFNVFSYYRVKRKIKSFQPNVVHLHNWHFAASPSVVWAVSHCRVPLVMTVHNYRLLCPSAILCHKGEMFFESLSGGFPWKAVANKVYRNSWFLSFWLACIIRLHRALGTWRKVDRIITLSEFAKQIFLKSDLQLQDKTITVKPNFVELAQLVINCLVCDYVLNIL